MFKTVDAAANTANAIGFRRIEIDLSSRWPRKRMSAKPPRSAGSPIFAALEDRRALLLGYVKNDVVTLDRLALLWTIEAACGGSLSRAPETHPVLLHLL